MNSDGEIAVVCFPDEMVDERFGFDMGGIRIKPSASANSYKGYRPNFYGQYRNKDGRNTEIKLQTRICGKPPASGLLSDIGDAAFEKSRGAAEYEFKQFLSDSRDAKIATAKLVASVSLSTGVDSEDLPLSKLSDWYFGMRGMSSDGFWNRWKKSAIDRFAEWAKGVGVRSVYSVSQETALKYCETLSKDVSRETLRKSVHALSGAFHERLPGTMKNPFENAFRKIASYLKCETSSVHRAPLTEEEILSLWSIAKEKGKMWGDIAVTATCTGMRIGDVCNLKWDNVNLEDGFIDGIMTAKTGACIAVPIFDCDETSELYHPILGALRRILVEASASRVESDTYVFREAHEMYEKDRHALYLGGKKIFAEMLYEKSAGAATTDRMKKRFNGNDSLKAVFCAIDNSNWLDKKKTRIKKCCELFCSGMPYREIEKKMAYRSRGHITMDLKEVEKILGERIRPLTAFDGLPNNRDKIKLTKAARTGGGNSISIYGWHSLRHTFVVFAINAGVPIDTVRTIVGHTTTDMTMEYYNPTRRIAAEHMKETLRRNISGKEKSAAEKITAALNSLSQDDVSSVLNYIASLKMKTHAQGQML